MNLKKYITSMSGDELEKFAGKAGTSVAYIRQLASGHRKAGLKSISGIVAASNGNVTANDLRPDMFDEAA